MYVFRKDSGIDVENTALETKNYRGRVGYRAARFPENILFLTF